MPPQGIYKYLNLNELNNEITIHMSITYFLLQIILPLCKLKQYFSTNVHTMSTGKYIEKHFESPRCIMKSKPANTSMQQLFFSEIIPLIIN